MQSLGQSVTDKVTDKVTQTQQKIILLIQKNPQITIYEISTALNLSDSGVRKNIAKLQETGIIRRKGSSKTGYWEIIE